MAIHRSFLGLLSLWCMSYSRRLQKENEDAMLQQPAEASVAVDSQSFAEVGHESSRIHAHSTAPPLSKLAAILLAGTPATAFRAVPNSFHPGARSNANAHPIVSHRVSLQRTQVLTMSMDTDGGASDALEQVLDTASEDVPSDVPSDSVEGTQDLDVQSVSSDVSQDLDVPSDTQDLDVPSDTSAEEVAGPQKELLMQVHGLLERVTGLDRGLLASDADVRAIDAAASEIESNTAAHEVDWFDPESRSKLEGRWRLAYTSAFAPNAIAGSGSLGGSRPGPRSGGPVTLGAVYQDIQTAQGRLINAIEPLSLSGPLPPVTPTVTVNVELGHELDLRGKQEIRIIGNGVAIKPAGAFKKLPELDLQLSKLPLFEQVRALLPLDLQTALYEKGGSSFRVTYMDDNTRITRGDRDELRVFVRS